MYSEGSYKKVLTVQSAERAMPPVPALDMDAK
jgi:hypothetical protein